MNIAEFIKETFGKSFSDVVLKLLDVVKSITDLLMAHYKKSEKKDQEKKQKEKEDKIDNVSSNGTLDDLLDLGKGR